VVKKKEDMRTITDVVTAAMAFMAGADAIHIISGVSM
jgi:hypothetical protein